VNLDTFWRLLHGGAPWTEAREDIVIGDDDHLAGYHDAQPEYPTHLLAPISAEALEALRPVGPRWHTTLHVFLTVDDRVVVLFDISTHLPPHVADGLVDETKWKRLVLT
jgi:hypothetical protein